MECVVLPHGALSLGRVNDMYLDFPRPNVERLLLTGPLLVVDRLLERQIYRVGPPSSVLWPVQY